MGCWNATCQISQLPIFAGDKVRFLLLTHSPYSLVEAKINGNEENCGEGAAKDGCYSTDFWFPRTIPIKAQYNDYGSVENAKLDINAEIWFDGFKQDLIELPQGKNEYHQSAVKKDMNFDQLLKNLQDGRLRVTQTGSFCKKGRELPVCQAMIREDVYQSILSMPLETWIGETISFDLVYKDAKSFFNSTYKDSTQLPGMSKGVIKYLVREGKANFSLSGIPFTIGLEYYNEWLVDKFVDKKLAIKDRKVQGLIKDIAEFYYVSRGFSLLRKGWGPQVGAGSQGSNLEFHHQFHSSIAGISKKIIEEFEE